MKRVKVLLFEVILSDEIKLTLAFLCFGGLVISNQLPGQGFKAGRERERENIYINEVFQNTFLQFFCFL